MAYKTGNRVRETSSSTGTGNLTLTGAVAGHIGFDDAQLAMANGDAVCYGCAASNGQWEVGRGLYLNSGGTRRLWRQSPSFGSSGQNINVNFAAAPEVYITTLAEDARTFGPFSLSSVGTNQVIAAATTTKVLFDTNEENDGGNVNSSGMWNTAGRYAHGAQADEDGWYRLYAKVDATTTFGGDSYLSLYKNNVERRRGPTLNGVKSLWVEDEFFMNGTTDQADFRITTASGGTIASGPTLSYCIARWVRRP